MSKQKSPSDPAKEAAKNFYKSACLEYDGAWSNAVPWFMEALQGEIFEKENLFDRIINAHDKAKKTTRADMDHYCTDGRIRVYTKVKKVPDDIRGKGKYKMNYGGDETYNILEMTTQSWRFFVILGVSKHTKKVNKIHIRMAKASCSKFDFHMIRYGDLRDNDADWNKTNCQFVCTVESEIKVEDEKIVNAGFSTKDAIHGWKNFNWWHVYFKNLEYVLEVGK